MRHSDHSPGSYRNVVLTAGVTSSLPLTVRPFPRTAPEPVDDDDDDDVVQEAFPGGRLPPGVSAQLASLLQVRRRARCNVDAQPLATASF